jgi:DNA-binding winged helix-turn-helix (wHTH) protein/tetratricopeptide (TPR) repeat protein
MTSVSTAKCLTGKRFGRKITGMTTVRFGAFELLAGARELWRDGRRVHVAPQAMRILIELTAVADEIVTRDHLRSVLWPDGTYVEFERSLNTAVRKLRVALGDDADSPRYVQTVPGRGYRLIAPITVVRPSTLAPREPRFHPRLENWRVAFATGAACGAMSIALLLVVPHMQQGRAVAARLVGGDQSAREEAATSSRAALEWYRRGQAAAHTGRMNDLGAAVDAFESAVRLDPEFAPAWAGLARARATRAVRDGRDENQFHLADVEATRALALDPDLADAYVAIGQVRFSRDRDFGGAEALLLRARTLGATAGRDAVWLASVLNAQRRFEAALRVLDEAIVREPQMAALHAWRGLLLHALHRYDDELTALQRAALMDPLSEEAAFHLGMGYARRRQYGLALPALRQAAALSGGGGYYVSWYGRMAADAGDFRAAEDALQQLQTIARTRGLAPPLSDAVSYHIHARRHRSGDL